MYYFLIPGKHYSTTVLSKLPRSIMIFIIITSIVVLYCPPYRKGFQLKHCKLITITIYFPDHIILFFKIKKLLVYPQYSSTNWYLYLYHYKYNIVWLLMSSHKLCKTLFYLIKIIVHPILYTLCSLSIYAKLRSQLSLLLYLLINNPINIINDSSII